MSLTLDKICTEIKEKSRSHKSVILTRQEGRVGIIQLNRPAKLNALNDALMDALGEALLSMDCDVDIGCIVLMGSAKSFSSGADLDAIETKTFAEAFEEDFITRNWEVIRQIRKPVIAAVAGYALGGGCELAMMCDFIIAAHNAKFGHPEIKVGIIPGAGGTQRLPRAVSKAKAMDMILTGRLMDAAEAERTGLVSRVVPLEKLEEEVLDAAHAIASMSMISVLAAKEAVNRSYETNLHEGVLFERRMFHSLFGTRDQKEGMAAFREKRNPRFNRGRD
jgi:enoyl-CoA hydratase